MISPMEKYKLQVIAVDSDLGDELKYSIVNGLYETKNNIFKINQRDGKITITEKFPIESRSISY